jgi:hypothetical protein
MKIEIENQILKFSMSAQEAYWGEEITKMHRNYLESLRNLLEVIIPGYAATEEWQIARRSLVDAHSFTLKCLEKGLDK